MATQYGLTSTGFVPKPLQQIVAEISATLQGTFGANINLGPESIFGQFVGIFAEREALLWQLMEAIYASQYPSGAEGTAVDNILALNAQKRQQATPSVVDLVLTGTPGTVIDSGSLVQTSTTPILSFATNSTVTIAAAVNAIQTLFFSSVPTQGAFTLSIVDPNGNTDTTSTLYWMSPIGAGTSVLQAPTAPVSGSFQISVNALLSASLNYSCTAAQVQSALQALSGYGSVTVSGSSLASGFTITWTGVSSAAARVASVTNSTLNAAAYIGNSIQDAIQLLTPDMSTFPFAGCTLTGSFGAGIAITFAGSAGAQAQNPFTVATNSLFNGAVAVNINVVNTTTGSPAQATVTANCTVTGPNFVIADSVTVIATPVSGWTGVNNPLDSSIGTNVASDTQALQTRTELLAEQANGPIQSIIEKVEALSGVSQVVGFQNLSNASIQNLTWASVPSTGTYKLQFGGLSALQTAALNYNASASSIQAAVNVLFGYGDVTITGTYQTGFVIQWGATSGSGAQPLVQVVSNTTGVTPTVVNGRPGKSFEILVDYPGLPLINSTLEAQIGQEIYSAKPAGMTSHGAPVLTTTGTTSAGSNQLTSLAATTNIAVGMTVIGAGIPINTTITAIVSSTVTMSNNATLSGSVTVNFKTVIQITDSKGNFYYLPFSKPQLVPIYVAINLTVSRATFPANGIAQIQQDMVAIGDSLVIGEQVTLFGTNGLVGAFNSVPGIINYSLAADVVTNPVNTANIPMGQEQLAQIESFNIICTVTYE